jgi:shikimate kinase
MKNIYLVGFMGTGKTTVGQIVAGILGKEFIETDSAIEQREGKKIAQIFEEKGQAHFRTLETKLLKEIVLKADCIVSCGGGLICNYDNIKSMRESGTIICFRAPAQVIYERIKHYTHRPLLNVKEPLAEIQKLLIEREIFYSHAHFFIDTEDVTPAHVAQAVIAIIKDPKTH